MTDEEIEKALESCLWTIIADCKDCPLDPKKPCTTNLHIAALEYITRLKGEIAGLTGEVEALKTDNDNLTCTLKECDEELEERVIEADENAALAMEQKLRSDKLEEKLKTVRKETAKEILDEISIHYSGAWLDKQYKKYGVDVEE